MTTPFAPQLAWIDSQRDRMTALLTDWCNINSCTGNVLGITAMSTAIRAAFPSLGEWCEVTLPDWERTEHGVVTRTPLGRALAITKRPNAPLRVFLCIHMDTVYPPGGPFQTVEQTAPNRLRGPAVADPKGVLVVMLTALEAFEQNAAALNIGWELLINPDEEIGSPVSAPLFVDAAKRNHLGLLFEPSMDDAGTLAGARKGSGNFTIEIRGRAAHAGRDFEKGRNAIVAAADAALALDAISEPGVGVTVNVARVDGGGAVNVVPDTAVVRFNVRVAEPEQVVSLSQRIHRVVERIGRRDGISATLTGGITAPPKPITPAILSLFEYVAACGKDLGLSIGWKNSGGVSDGNRLFAAGLPNVDSLGVRGGAIHSPDEYVLTESLPERAKLTALLLFKLASGELKWPA